MVKGCGQSCSIAACVLKAIGSSPNRFGPSVPRKKPHSIHVQITPIMGMRFISTHHPDLLRSCHLFISTANDGQITTMLKSPKTNWPRALSTPNISVRTDSITPIPMKNNQNGWRFIRPSNEINVCLRSILFLSKNLSNSSPNPWTERPVASFHCDAMSHTAQIRTRSGRRSRQELGDKTELANQPDDQSGYQWQKKH